MWWSLWQRQKWSTQLTYQNFRWWRMGGAPIASSAKMVLHGENVICLTSPVEQRTKLQLSQDHSRKTFKQIIWYKMVIAVWIEDSPPFCFRLRGNMIKWLLYRLTSITLYQQIVCNVSAMFTTSPKNVWSPTKTTRVPFFAGLKVIRSIVLYFFFRKNKRGTATTTFTNKRFSNRTKTERTLWPP